MYPFTNAACFFRLCIFTIIFMSLKGKKKHRGNGFYEVLAYLMVYVWHSHCHIKLLLFLLKHTLNNFYLQSNLMNSQRFNSPGFPLGDQCCLPGLTSQCKWSLAATARAAHLPRNATSRLYELPWDSLWLIHFVYNKNYSKELVFWWKSIILLILDSILTSQV